VTDIILRHAEPTDYQPIISVIDDWWGGRQMAAMLPKLFFIHFRPTSFIAEHDGNIVGFLAGFVSQTFPDEAYIHFVGVHPAWRAKGVGRALYERFFSAAAALGCRRVRCATSPVNTNSITFHRRMGFLLEESDTRIDGVPVAVGYDGQGGDRVLFCKHLDP
jgi:GNAT superfamily N-acetyltransferase